MVDFLNKNPEAKVVVTGYADKGTGNDVINDRIAAKRAAAVVWMLTKKYNIPSERITEEAKGARVQPFAENAENRVTIMIAK
ncbi:OmpA family protein [Segatella copri]|uniref:OmpA family protein n=1 Tax=Segatella copri TaxID=165179 RepID=UPI00293ACDCF|nr:OmpA family protein [Segatella copri]MDV3106983.1 OmpA family protein [Segatella copri]MDV3113384.1 OmpA family protein [Segatella copri]